MLKKFQNSLRTRLILIVILAALPALGITLYSALEQRQEAAHVAQDEVLRVAQVATVNQELFVEDTRVLLVALSHLPALRNRDLAACQDLFSHLFTEHLPFYDTFYVADLEGNVVCSAPTSHLPSDLITCEHYNLLKATQDLVISNYHICKSTGKPILSMGYPIFDEQEQFSLVLNMGIDLQWFSQLADDIHLPEGAVLNIFDNLGTILTQYPEPGDLVGSLVSKESVLHSLLEQGEGTAIGPGLDGVTRLYALTPMTSSRGSVHVSLGIPLEVAYAEANHTLFNNLLLLGAVTLFSLAAAWFLSDVFILRQTNTVIQSAQRLAAGDLDARTHLPPEGELGQLAQAFDHMAEALSQRETERNQAEQAIREYAASLERSNRDLQDFANIASHDLQEPLRKIQTFSELLQTRNSAQLDERGLDYLGRMNKAAQRMQTLIDELLTYSRISTRARPIENVDLTEIALGVVQDLDMQIDESAAKVEVEELPTIEADTFQMHQLFQNLVSNSLKFRKQGLAPIVKISGSLIESQDGGNQKSKKKQLVCRITVTDNGIGFDEKYLARIFQPFQRLHGQGEYDGAGMGLAICRKIVERHGGSITAHSQPGQGATFIIHLPVRQPRTGAQE